MHSMSILLATDGSAEALAAAAWLDRWTRPEFQQITLATVIPTPTMSWGMGVGGYVIDADLAQKTYQEVLAEEREAAGKILEATRGQLNHAKPIHEEILVGYPARALVEYAQTHHFDLIVMGRRGHSALGNLVGSVSFSVMQRSPIPVTIVS